jgi:hypothetical protein
VSDRDPSVSADAEDARYRARLAISELFLDTELDDAAFVRLRDVLRTSGLSLDELDAIYYDELAPILHANLRTPAGVWSGFDPVWLQQEIERRGKLRVFPLVGRVRRYLITQSTIEDWRRLRALVAG